MNKKIKILPGIALVLACLGVVILAAPSVLAGESKPASPGFGDPVNADNAKVTGDAAKCKPGDSGCAVVGYKCYKGAKRSYYVNNSSECGVEEDEVSVDKDGKTVKKTVMYYLNIVINVVLGVMGVVSVVMIILGGINYTTSQGDPTKAGKAQKTIIFSIVGLVVALLAFAIVNFVLTNVFKG